MSDREGESTGLRKTVCLFSCHTLGKKPVHETKPRISSERQQENPASHAVFLLRQAKGLEVALGGNPHHFRLSGATQVPVPHCESRTQRSILGLQGRAPRPHSPLFKGCFHPSFHATIFTF